MDKSRAAEGAQRRLGRDPADAPKLEVCPVCASRLVLPVEWAPAADRAHWRVSFRCPECEWRGAGTYDQETVDRFDEALDRGVEAMLSDLEFLAKANMEDEMERFIRALWADLIVPQDF